jgi:hypothetical protein
VSRTPESGSDHSRLANIASSVRITAKRLGWLHTLLWSSASLGRRFSIHIFVVTVHDIDENEGRDDPNAVGFEGHLLTPDEVLRSFNRTEGYSYSRAFAIDALARGDRCFGLFEGERLVWYCWYARASAPAFDDVDVVSEFPFLYAYNAYTDADRRGRGLHRIGVVASGRFFAREGYRAITAYMEAHNLPPLIAARAMGERFVGFVVLRRGAQRVRWFATRGCRDAVFRIQCRSSETSLRWAANEDRRAS